MAQGINKVILIGTLGQDPETRYMPSGGAVTSFSIATNESWKDKKTGEKMEKCEWHNIVTFNKLAEICGEYLTKGKQVYIEGKLTTEKWQDKQGNDRYTTKINAHNMQMLGGKGDTGKPATGQGQQNQQRQQAPQQGQPQNAPVDDSFDDGIPW